MRIRTEGVTWQQIDGELVILDLQTSRYLTTNAVGALLAKHLTDERTMEDLIDFLLSNYSIDRDTAERDVQAFVAQLESKDLLLHD